MPARRPYASRGVPRRATTRQARGTTSAVGLAGLAAVLVLVLLGVALVADSFSSGSKTPIAAPATQADGSGASDAPAGAVLQMAEVPGNTSGGPAATAPTVQPTPTSIPLGRQWDTSAAGLVVDPVLVGRLDRALVGVDGHVSVAVKDLGSGRGALLDGDRELAAASLYKLPVLYTVFDAGLGMGEELLITDEARSYDTGSMELGVGETLTVAEALERMVTLSDNTSAVMLGDRVGANRVNASIAALGMDSTHYSLERMTTSALDMMHFLDLLAHGKTVSPAASADMVHLLLRQRVNDRLPRLLPDDVRVAHKTGNLPGTVNDVGILYGASSTVAVAVLVSDTSDETAAATGIARVALAAESYFEDQPEDSTRPLIPRAPARAIPPVRREPRPVPTVAPTAPVEEVTITPTVIPAVEPATAVVPTVVAPKPVPTIAATSVPTLAPTVAPSSTPAPQATPVPPPASPTAPPPQPTRLATRPPLASPTPAARH